jgi:hypothetical protein
MRRGARARAALNDPRRVESSSSGLEQWLNLVVPALMRVTTIDVRVERVRDIASMSEVSPVLRRVALRQDG